jgi:hypothetical protein
MNYIKMIVKVKATADGNRYFIDGYETPTLRLDEGKYYYLDQSDLSNTGHPLRFSTVADGTHNGGSGYTTGVTTSGTPGQAAAYTMIKVGAAVIGAPELWYYCNSHADMGGQATTDDIAINKEPLFVGKYRQDHTELRPTDANEPILAFNPGRNGSRIHQIALRNEDPSNAAVLHFGYMRPIFRNIGVNLVPGSTAASDPFTMTRTDAANWSASTDHSDLIVGDLISLGTSVAAANRGAYRVASITTTVLTLTNTPGNTITQQLGQSVTAYKFISMFSMSVAALAGYGGAAAVSGMDLTQAPWLDGDRWWLCKHPLYIAKPADTAGAIGSVYIDIYSGDY